MRTALAVACLLLSLASQPTFGAADLCQDPRLPEPMNGAGCRTAPIRYWDGTQEIETQVAVIPIRMIQDYDFFYPEYSHHLLLPDGSLVDLGRFWQGNSNVAERFLFNALGIHPAGAGGTRFIDRRYFHDRRLERDGAQFCMAYYMKPPLTGSFRDCDGRSSPAGRIGYGEGVATWLDAISLACDAVSGQSDGKCRHNGLQYMWNVIRRDEQDKLYYIVALSRRLSSPSEYDFLLYRITAEGRQATLIKQTTDSPNAHDWMR